MKSSTSQFSLARALRTSESFFAKIFSVVSFQEIFSNSSENILLVTGENPAKAGVPYLAKAIDIAKKYFSNIKIEVMPLKAEEYKELTEHGTVNQRDGDGFGGYAHQ